MNNEQSTRCYTAPLVRLMRLICLLCVAGTAWSQPYPAKPVRVIVPFPPAGANDIAARITFPKVSEQMGQSFIIENRGGAGGTIGTALVAQSKPDGYTLLVQSIASHVANAHLYRKLPYDALRDFVPVINLASSPNALIVGMDVPVNSVKELVAWVKSKPVGEVNYASAGNGTSMHLGGELFNALTGAKTTHIPYKGSPEGVTAVVKGEVAMMFPNVPNAIPLAKSGKLKILAVTTSKRLASMPDVPTVIEGGLAGFDVTAWFGLVAPAGTPSDIVQRLNAESNKALAMPAVRQALANQGFEIGGGSPQEFGQFMRAEIDKWTKVVNGAGIPKL